MKITYSRVFTGAILTAAVLFSCGYLSGRRSGGEGGESLKAVAEVNGFVQNTIKGTVNFYETQLEGLHITGEIEGLLPDSSYAIHIHSNGNCENTDAPGPHFDPGQSGMHGAPGGSPDTHHAGDLPNIKANGSGKAKVDFTTNSLSASSSVFSVLGKSIVIHSNKDDYATQPDGGSGQKIACGVIKTPSK